MYSQEQSNYNNQLIEEHAPLVKKIAYHLMARLPASVQVDDLIQAGLIGLLDAGKHYNSSLGAQFVTYATIRVRGAMLDEVRRSDWVPKSVHKKARDVAAAIHEIETKTGRDARDVEVAGHLGIPLDEYHRILWENSTSKVLNIEDLDTEESTGISMFQDASSNVVSELIEDEYKKRLSEEILNLPERERLVMSLYYDTEMNLKEVGHLLDISESRVSQMLSQAQHRLKARLNYDT
ncbi:MAG: RNA polymerase sigma factor FliA [Gammaproteobacteria bacterium]|nr:RNA polymerase sigma factor FliA [Gammaproteobacteria bacterium]